MTENYLPFVGSEIKRTIHLVLVLRPLRLLEKVKTEKTETAESSI